MRSGEFITDVELACGLSLAHIVTYTTVRGPFRMAALVEEQVRDFPTLSAFLGELPAYGAYVIAYAEGAEKTVHVDPVPRKGFEHERVVVCLQAAEEGGLLLVNGGLAPLSAGEMVFFRADLSEHAVSKVTRGERIVLTVGKLVPA